MTNYINSIELNGSTYNIGPCYFSGSDNVIVGGSPSFSSSAANNIIIATPGTPVSCGNNVGGVFLAAGSMYVQILSGGVTISNQIENAAVRLGSAINVSNGTIDVGPVHFIKISLDFSTGHRSASIDINNPCELFIFGTYNYSTTYVDTVSEGAWSGAIPYYGYARIDMLDASTPTITSQWNYGISFGNDIADNIVITPGFPDDITNQDYAVLHCVLFSSGYMV